MGFNSGFKGLISGAIPPLYHTPLWLVQWTDFYLFLDMMQIALDLKCIFKLLL